MRYCSIDGCERPVKGHGLCGMHYARMRSHGSTDRLIRTPYVRELCIVEGCESPARSRNLCHRHYERMRLHGDPLVSLARKRGVCSIEGCGKPHYCRSYCSRHYSSFRVYGDPLTAKEFEYHGLRKHPLYSVWNGMRSRCYSVKDPSYHRYGGRGITVCERWRNSFQAFYDDVAPRPEGLTLDREKNNLGYWCGKCDECLANGWPKNWRWATASQQSQNQRPKSNNTSGHAGIYRYNNKWMAMIIVNYKRIKLGYFPTKREAIAAYKAAKRKYHTG